MGQHRSPKDGLIFDNFESFDSGRERRADDTDLPRGDDDASRKKRPPHLRLLRQRRDFDTEQFSLFLSNNQIVRRVRLLQGQSERKRTGGFNGNRNGSKPKNCGTKYAYKSSEREHT